MMVAKLSLFFGRFAKMFDSRDRFVVYVVVVFLMKNCCVSSRGKSILTKKKRAFDADNFPQHPTILEKRLKWKNDDKALTFVLSAIDVTGFPRLSTRSCPCTIAFTSVLIVFLIVFAFCNMMMMNESRDERQIVFFFQSSSSNTTTTTTKNASRRRRSTKRRRLVLLSSPSFLTRKLWLRVVFF